MKSIILISGAVIFLVILFFAMGYLKKLRKAFDHADVKNFSGSDAERIVNAYRTEDGYLKRRTRVWLLTIALEAAVVLTTFGSVYYLANKDRWTTERELTQAQKQEEQLKALLAEKQALAEGVPLKIFRYKQKRLKKAQEKVDEALADYRKAEKKLAEAQKQNAENDKLLKKADSLLAQKNDVSKSQAVSLKNKLENIAYADIPALQKEFAEAENVLNAARKNVEIINNMSVDELERQKKDEKQWCKKTDSTAPIMLLLSYVILLSLMLLSPYSFWKKYGKYIEYICLLSVFLALLWYPFLYYLDWL